MPPEFEHDSFKSLVNLRKHGLTLADAEKLWLDPHGQYGPSRCTHGEHRYQITAQREGKLWTCIFTLRQGRLRLISCRRAWTKESRAYFRRRA